MEKDRSTNLPLAVVNLAFALPIFMMYHSPTHRDSFLQKPSRETLIDGFERSEATRRDS